MELSNFGCQPATETEPIEHVIILEIVRPTNDGGQLDSVACIVEYFVKSDTGRQSRDRIRDRFRHHAASRASQFTGIPAKRGLVPLASQQVWRANIVAGYSPNQLLLHRCRLAKISVPIPSSALPTRPDRGSRRYKLCLRLPCGGRCRMLCCVVVALSMRLGG